MENTNSAPLPAAAQPEGTATNPATTPGSALPENPPTAQTPAVAAVQAPAPEAVEPPPAAPVAAEARPPQNYRDLFTAEHAPNSIDLSKLDEAIKQAHIQSFRPVHYGLVAHQDIGSLLRLHGLNSSTQKATVTREDTGESLELPLAELFDHAVVRERYEGLIAPPPQPPPAAPALPASVAAVLLALLIPVFGFGGCAGQQTAPAQAVATTGAAVALNVAQRAADTAIQAVIQKAENPADATAKGNLLDAAAGGLRSLEAYTGGLVTPQLVADTIRAYTDPSKTHWGDLASKIAALYAQHATSANTLEQIASGLNSAAASS